MVEAIPRVPRVARRHVPESQEERLKLALAGEIGARVVLAVVVVVPDGEMADIVLQPP